VPIYIAKLRDDYRLKKKVGTTCDMQRMILSPAGCFWPAVLENGGVSPVRLQGRLVDHCCWPFYGTLAFQVLMEYKVEVAQCRLLFVTSSPECAR